MTKYFFCAKNVKPKKIKISNEISVYKNMQTKQGAVTIARSVKLGIVCTAWFTSTHLQMMSLTNGYHCPVDMNQPNRERPCTNQLMSDWPEERKGLIPPFLLWSMGHAAQWGTACPPGYDWSTMSHDRFTNSERRVGFMRRTRLMHLQDDHWDRGIQLFSSSIQAPERHLVLKTN